MQIAVRPKREQWRGVQCFIGIQDAIPGTFGGMRRKPFGEICSRKLVGGEIELKYTSRNDAGRGVRSDARPGAMPRRCNRAAPVRAAGPCGNLLHQYRVRSERQSR